MEAKTKELLNKFADSQPALNDKDKPHATAPIQLGDLIAAVEAAAAAAQADATAAESAAYTAGTPGDWDTAAPTTLKEALDRIASALAVAIAGPIP